MPAGFQKTMEYTIVGFRKTRCFLDNFNFIVSRGSLENRMILIYDCFRKP